jgi:hypothetical protein
VFAPPDMFGHLCFVPAAPEAGELADGDEAACDELAEGCDLAVPVCAVVEALAMVRPRARLAPSAPAPTAVPISGRVILTWFSFCFARRDPLLVPADPLGRAWVGPRRSVGQPELAGDWAEALSPV